MAPFVAMPSLLSLVTGTMLSTDGHLKACTYFLRSPTCLLPAKPETAAGLRLYSGLVVLQGSSYWLVWAPSYSPIGLLAGVTAENVANLANQVQTMFWKSGEHFD